MAPGSAFGLIGFVGLCLLVGASAGSLMGRSVETWYPNLTPPPGTPPNWAFPVAWTLLYVAMGVAAWLVWRRAGIARRRHYAALRLWGWQLLVNALWTPVFFALHWLGIAVFVAAALVALVAATVWAFRRVDGVAAWIMAPYLAWVAYAAYLSAGFWWLNAV